MMKLPMGDVHSDYHGMKDTIAIKREEEVTIWPWADRAIFPWPKPVVWIKSPVTGKKRWPGDLWGVDSQGQLVIVESKLGNSTNPFEDFLSYRPRRGETEADDLLARWEKEYASECQEKCPPKERKQCWEERAPGQTLGILPRSQKRKYLWKWKSLAKMIEKYIGSEDYPRTVRRYLEARKMAGNPFPHFCGLIAGLAPELSPTGSKAATKLIDRHGKDKVHLFEATATVTEDGRYVVLKIKKLPLP